jgi:hypothetical protein
MMQTSKTKKHVSAESIARMADRGEDVSGFFTNTAAELIWCILC